MMKRCGGLDDFRMSTQSSLTPDGDASCFERSCLSDSSSSSPSLDIARDIKDRRKFSTGTGCKSVGALDETDLLPRLSIKPDKSSCKPTMSQSSQP